MSTETETKKPTVTNWALLHELVLRANTAKDFKTLGEAMEVLSGIMSEFPPCFGEGCAQSYFQSACSKAAKYMADKLFAWVENPPPIAPQETQIGPGNPFPPPPPPPPTVAPGGWTGALVFERIAPKGLTNPVGYPAATPDEQAELDRMARAINRNTPLFEPTPQAPGSLDALKAKILDATAKCYNAPASDAAKAVNILYTSIVKAFDEHAAQNAKAIERAAAPVKTPEPWTGESLYLAADMQLMEAPGDWTTLTSFQQKLWMLAASAANERMGSAPSPLKPWTAEQFFIQFGCPDRNHGIVASVRLSSAHREGCEKAATVINKWAGLVS